MVSDSSLIASVIPAIAVWQHHANKALTVWQQTLVNEDLLTPTIEEHLEQALLNLTKNRYMVAILGEVSRGKSELINALLFGQYSQRIIPAGAGRTTMCPVEFFCDPTVPPYLELLPISSRMPLEKTVQGVDDHNNTLESEEIDLLSSNITPLRDLYHIPSAWQRYSLENASTDRLAFAMQKIIATQMLTRTEAQQLGFFYDDTHYPSDVHTHNTSSLNPLNPNINPNPITNTQTLNTPHAIPTQQGRSATLNGESMSMVELPMWRYARVNWHHPLLATGLAILDTPGLNTLGYEAELTHEILPYIDAGLLMVDACIGMTHSDQLIWKAYFQHLPPQNTRVVLNKIDTLIDPFTPNNNNDNNNNNDVLIASLDKITQQIATQLSIPKAQVLAVSARQGLLAQVLSEHNTVEFKEKTFNQSRLPLLQTHLSTHLLEKCQMRVKHHVLQTLVLSYHTTIQQLGAKIHALHNQLGELSVLSDSKDRLQAIHTYAADTQKRYHLETSLESQLKHSMDIFIGKLTEMFSASDIQQGFISAIETCQTNNSAGIKQHLKIALAGAQIRFTTAHSELKQLHQIVLQSLESFIQLNLETTGQSAIQDDDLKETARLHLESLLPDVLDLNPLISELAQLTHISLSDLPSLPLLSASQRQSAADIIHNVMKQSIQLGTQAQHRLIGWLAKLRKPIENAIEMHQASLLKRSETLIRMQEAQVALKEGCEHASQALKMCIEQKKRLEQGYCDAQTILKEANKHTVHTDSIIKTTEITTNNNNNYHLNTSNPELNSNSNPNDSVSVSVQDETMPLISRYA